MYTPATHFTLSVPGLQNDFKVSSFEGSEAISSLFSIEVDLVSEYQDFDIESLLCQPAFLQFGLNGEGIHGLIDGVFRGESGKRLTHYRVTLVPALHYLQFSYDHRIFQHLAAPQIVAQVLKRHGIQADAFIFHVSDSPQREYCTQYGESDFDFIQRVCAEDGIAWHHQHSPDGHLLVFTDDQTFFPKLGQTPYLQGSGMTADNPVVSQFSMCFSSRTSTVTRRDYDLKRPTALLESKFTAEFSPELEDYRYPLLLESEKDGKRLARQALERHRTDYQLAEGNSDQPMLRSGHFFTLTEHPHKSCNELWLLLSVHHCGKQPQALEEMAIGDAESGDGFTQGYRNSFSAIPWDVFFRPPLHKRKSVLVSQTARVTGPVGEEIYCDEYGRVKVEFPWDRAELDSEKSSCWLRVSSSWAGEGFGSITIPRVGMEVVVTYLEGDPDRPLITGCVINKTTPAPYALPQNKTKTLLRSHSSPHTGGYNELSIEDRAGQELIFLRAQRDIEQQVLNDSDIQIGNDRREQVGRDSVSMIVGDETQTTQGQRNTVIGGNELVAINGNSSTTAAGTLVIQARPQAHFTASNVVIDAGTSLTLKAGGHHILITAGGIFTSVDLIEGGTPVAGVTALQAVARAPQPIIATPLSIFAATKQHATDFCPLCEACLDGQCSLGETA